MNPNKLQIDQRDLSEIINHYCACGGRGLHDPEACEACIIYHEIMEIAKGEK